LTTGWGAPRRKSELAHNIAAGDREALESVWKGVSGERAETVIAIALAAAGIPRTLLADAGTIPPPPESR